MMKPRYVGRPNIHGESQGAGRPFDPWMEYIPVVRAFLRSGARWHPDNHKLVYLLGDIFYGMKG